MVLHSLASQRVLFPGGACRKRVSQGAWKFLFDVLQVCPDRRLTVGASSRDSGPRRVHLEKIRRAASQVVQRVTGGQ